MKAASCSWAGCQTFASPLLIAVYMCCFRITRHAVHCVGGHGNGPRHFTIDAPGCRETVIDGDNGFLVPVKSFDALERAMQLLRWRNDFSAGARRI